MARLRRAASSTGGGKEMSEIKLKLELESNDF
jgi:hypothetical protein